MATDKITVTLPSHLLARIEQRRREIGANRSETITELLWRGWRAMEDDDRAERYRAAYAAQPETGESAFSREASAQWLASLDSWHDVAPDDPPTKQRRARAAR